jgi:O-methyltransferase
MVGEVDAKNGRAPEPHCRRDVRHHHDRKARVVMKTETGAAPDIRARMWDMIVAYRTSQLVRTAALMSLAEHCAAGTVTAESLAAAESADPSATARFLRGCASIGLVICEEDRLYSGTPLLDVLRKDADGSQWGFAVSLPGPGHWLPWGELPEAVRTGGTRMSVVGASSIFDYYRHHPEEEAAFMAGLSGMTAVAGAEAARVIDTSDVRLAVDVGGATGTLLHDLMKVNAELRGIVLDVPAVAPQAAEAAEALGLQGRVEAVSGDFLDSVPAGGDLYLLRYVLHDWDDETCVRILRNCRAAMAPQARLMVLEMVLGTVGREPEVVPSQDLNMLAVAQGRERTVAEFDALLEAAGLRRVAVYPTHSPMSIVEAVAA